QFVGALGGHDAGNTRDRNNVPLALAREIIRQDHRQRTGMHDDLAFGDGNTFRHGLGADIDHAHVARHVDVGKGALGHGQAAGTVAGARSVRVAAATSASRIRLSPTRYAPIPARFSRAMSAGVNMPLSPTSTRAFGTRGARRSDTDSDVSKVCRSRLLMPIS